MPRPCPVAKGLMRPPLVVEPEVFWHPIAGLNLVSVDLQVDLPPNSKPATAAPRRCCPCTCSFSSRPILIPYLRSTRVNSKLVN